MYLFSNFMPLKHKGQIRGHIFLCKSDFALYIQNRSLVIIFICLFAPLHDDHGGRERKRRE